MECRTSDALVKNVLDRVLELFQTIRISMKTGGNTYKYTLWLLPRSRHYERYN